MADDLNQMQKLVTDAGGAVLLQLMDAKVAKQRKPVVELAGAVAILMAVFGVVQWIVAEKHRKDDSSLASAQHDHKEAEEKQRIENERALDDRRYRRTQLNAILDRFLAANSNEARLRVIGAIRGLPALDEAEKTQVRAMLDTLQHLIVVSVAPLTASGDGSSREENSSQQLKVQALQDLAEVQKKVGDGKPANLFRLQIAQGAACGELVKQAGLFKRDGYDARVYRVKKPDGCAITIGETDYQGALQLWAEFTNKRIKGFTKAVVVPRESYGPEFAAQAP